MYPDDDTIEIAPVTDDDTIEMAPDVPVPYWLTIRGAAALDASVVLLS